MSIDRRRNPYDKRFFDGHLAASLGSARVVVPLICALLRPRRVADVGCGSGAWLKAFQDAGVDFIRGFDGDYVDRDMLLIPSECFLPVDLTNLTSFSENYDLAICLEVLEHLSPRSGSNIVAALTEAAPIILFSAAPPGQGGTDHVNEQWPEYWGELFEARGYSMLDPIRPRIRDDHRVTWWYRQNILMFASKKAIAGNDALTREARKSKPQLEWVHVSMVRQDHAGKNPLRIVTRVLPVKLKRPLKTALSFAHLR